MNRSIVKVVRVLLVIFALAVWTLSGASDICAQTSTEQQQKKEKKKKKKAPEQKQTKQDDKAKKKSEPAAGVNRMYDSFKKNQGPAKDDAGSLRKSTNDAWDKSK